MSKEEREQLKNGPTLQEYLNTKCNGADDYECDPRLTGFNDDEVRIIQE